MICRYTCNIAFDKNEYIRNKKKQVQPISIESGVTFLYDLTTEERPSVTPSPTTNTMAEQAAISKEIIDAGTRIAEFFRDNRSTIIENASVRFIVDDNGHVWLSEIANCRVFELDQLSQLLEMSTDTLTPARKSKQDIEPSKLPEPSQDTASVISTITGTATEIISKKKKGKGQTNVAESKPSVPKKRRSKLDEPPSMELIAKFAAEKDR